MYKIFKPKGNNVLVTVENLETKSSIIIGKLNTAILSTLESSGCDVPETLTEEWNIEVNKEVATALTNMAMKMKKPIRNQSKKVVETKETNYNANTDAFDLIFGQV